MNADGAKQSPETGPSTVNKVWSCQATELGGEGEGGMGLDGGFGAARWKGKEMADLGSKPCGMAESYEPNCGTLYRCLAAPIPGGFGEERAGVGGDLDWGP